MALRRNYNDLGAQRLKDFTTGVINGLADTIFSSLAAAVAILTTLNTALGASILAFNERTKDTNDIMALRMSDVVKKLDEIRPLADEICDGDYAKEKRSGFTPNKQGRSSRKSIDPPVLVSAKPNGIAGELLIKLEATIPGNRGYEVHCVHGGNDLIKGTFYVKGRTKQLLATGFPSLTKVEVYVKTLSSNNVKSGPSNSIINAAAS